MANKLQDIQFNVPVYSQEEVDNLLKQLSSSLSIDSSTWKNIIESNTGIAGVLNTPKIIKNQNGRNIVEFANYAVDLNNYNEQDNNEYTSLILNKNIKTDNYQIALYYKNISADIMNEIKIDKSGININSEQLNIPEPINQSNAATKGYVDNKLLQIDIPNISDYINYNISEYIDNNVLLSMNKPSFTKDNARSYGFKFNCTDVIAYKPEIIKETYLLDGINLNQLSILNGNNGTGLNTKQLYCIIFDYDDSNLSNNNGLTYVCSSNETQENTANSVMNFTFNNVFLNAKKTYIITFSTINSEQINTSQLESVRLSKVQIPDEYGDQINHVYISSIMPSGNLSFNGTGRYTGNFSIGFQPKYSRIENVRVLGYNVSETVHTYGNENINGNKQFNDNITINMSDFSNSLKSNILNSYNYNYPNIITTNSLQNIGNINKSEKYPNIRPEENRMFDSTTVVLQVKINTDEITNIPISSIPSNVYSTDQKRLVQFELWNAGSLYVTSLNTANHQSNPNKISTRLNNKWSIPIDIPESKKLLIVWRFKHNTDTSMTIDSFINGTLALEPITISSLAKSINMTLFRDLDEEFPNWLIEKFEIYDKALSDDEIQELKFYTADNIINLTSDGIFLNDKNKKEFKDNEYITKQYIKTLLSDVSVSVNNTEEIKNLLVTIAKKLGANVQ